jgi:hypothetical protein
LTSEGSGHLGSSSNAKSAGVFRLGRRRVDRGESAQP